eukprot:Trichotokara_eunicae@DN6348_c0_g1_i3.p1
MQWKSGSEDAVIGGVFGTSNKVGLVGASCVIDDGKCTFEGGDMGNALPGGNKIVDIEDPAPAMGPVDYVNVKVAAGVVSLESCSIDTSTCGGDVATHGGAVTTVVGGQETFVPAVGPQLLRPAGLTIGTPFKSCGPLTGGTALPDDCDSPLRKIYRLTTEASAAAGVDAFKVEGCGVVIEVTTDEINLGGSDDFGFDNTALYNSIEIIRDATVVSVTFVDDVHSMIYAESTTEYTGDECTFAVALPTSYEAAEIDLFTEQDDGSVPPGGDSTEKESSTEEDTATEDTTKEDIETEVETEVEAEATSNGYLVTSLMCVASLFFL